MNLSIQSSVLLESFLTENECLISLKYYNLEEQVKSIE